MKPIMLKGLVLTWIVITCKLLIMWAESMLELMGSL